MARQLAAVLLLCFAAVGALAQPGGGGPFGGGPFGGGGPGQPDANSCQGQGQALPKGSCNDLLQFFNTNDDVYNKPQAQFDAVANTAPTPDARCCAQAQRFVAQGCTCDQGTLNNAGRIGTTSKAIQGLGRALPYKCSSVSNPCPAIPISS